MEIINKISTYIISIITILTAYKALFTIIGLFTKSKQFKPAAVAHSFGIVISARNERLVIGNLLESIAKQDYDMSRIKVFVVADNCTDDTADICRSHGAIVYERSDKLHARKGYALGYLFDCIKRDYGISSLDGYIVFDADNLLSSDFLKQINNAFDTGTDIVVGYRNSKNFSTNFISSAYGIHFFGSSMRMHRPRTLLGLSTHLAGTGYAMRADIVARGWHYFSLTEDTEFTLCSVSEGKRIDFCEAAEFYDEQPYQIKVMFIQRLRWIKGRIFSFLRYGHRLITGIFRKGTSKFSCYDMFFYSFPRSLFSALLSTTYTVSALIAGTVSINISTFSGALLNLLRALAVAYLSGVINGALIVFRERRHINCPTKKLVFYTLAYPWFDIVALPIAIISLFMHVEWRPIKHDEAIKIDEIEKAERINAK